ARVISATIARSPATEARSLRATGREVSKSMPPDGGLEAGMCRPVGERATGRAGSLRAIVSTGRTPVKPPICITMIVGEGGMVASENVSVKDEATMTPGSVREYAEAMRSRYVTAKTRAEKGRILTEFCQTTGYHRDSAIRVMWHSAAPSGKRRGRPRTYGHEVSEALKQLWEVADRICGKRLHPFLPELLESLERAGEIVVEKRIRCQLLGLSSATMDRLLSPCRRSLLRQPYVPSHSSSAIQALVPIRTFGEWEGVEVGSMQMDLVLHCGESLDGFYLTTLVAVDVATGWAEVRVVWGKGKERVGGAAAHIRKALPFALREMHTDNGGEFLNDALYPWARRFGIGFTRGRPYKKNDQAHVEQKNWSLVRQRVGYDRYSSKAAYVQLEKLYDSLRLYANFFQPLRKLVGKERVGSKVIKQYDRARTPYQRLLETEGLSQDKRAEVEKLYRKLNPAKLKREIDQSLEELWKLADKPGQAKAKTACG
ncbi:MAG TPA: transposase family protein, partial [Chloroflexota bacterium]|nr:transposase family protein [Chloroflexota bacterium]